MKEFFFTNMSTLVVLGRKTKDSFIRPFEEFHGLAVLPEFRKPY